MGSGIRSTMTCVCWLTDKGIRHLHSMPKLGELRLYKAGITDKALSHLKRFPALKVLDRQQTKMSKEKAKSRLPGVMIR